MALRNFFLDTFRHRLPRMLHRFQEGGARRPETSELAADVNKALQTLSEWGRDNPLDALKRGTSPKKGIQYLREMEENDGHYSAILDSRKVGLLARDWDVVPASDEDRDMEIADFVKWNLQNISGTMIETLNNALEGIPIGFSIGEMIYDQASTGEHAGKWTLKLIKDKDQGNIKFVTDEFGNLQENGVHYMQGMGSSKKLPPEKFFIYTFNKKRGNWYGNGIGVVCSWYSWFKRDGIKAWLILLQKWANPTALGRLPKDARTGDRDEMKDIIETISDRTGITLPEGFDIELLEATRRGDAGYILLLDYCDAQMSKKVLGATLTADQGKSGAYALGKVHAEVREEFVKFDAISLSDAFNEQVIHRLVDYNFLNVEGYPRLTFDFSIPVDRKQVAESIKEAQEAGIVVPVEWAHEETQIPIATDDQETLVPAPKSGASPFEEGKFAEGKTETKLRRKLIPREEKFSDLPGVSAQLDRFFDSALAQARQESVKIRDDILKQVKKKLVVSGTVKKSLRENPIVVNVSGLRKVLLNDAMSGWLWGQLHATRELERMGFTFRQSRLDKFQDDPAIPIPSQAVKFFKSKIPVTKRDFLQRLNKERDRYFTVAGLAKNDIERTIQPLILDAIEKGQTFADFRFAVEQEMVKYTGDVYSGTPLLRPAGAPMAEYHLSTVFRTNLMGAYNQGRREIYSDPDVGDFIPWLQYSAVMDERTSDFCDKYDGRIYPKDDPVWNTIFPPNHFNALVAGTKIRTIEGEENIEDIEVGEYVLSHRGSWCKVYDTMQEDRDTEIYEIELENGIKLEVTGEHPILAKSQVTQWFNAEDLREGMALFLPEVHHIIKLCPICGKEYSARPEQQFCSNECRAQSKVRRRFCRYCGNEILSKGKKKNKHFCSQKCMGEHLRKYVDKHCLNCGKAMRASWKKGIGITPERRFCSRSCYLKYKGRTNIEEKLAQILEKLDLMYQEQVKIGKYVVDFLLPDKNIVIEADGNYWHTTKERWDVRRAKDELLTRSGYDVLHIGQDKILGYKFEEELKGILDEIQQDSIN